MGKFWRVYSWLNISVEWHFLPFEVRKIVAHSSKLLGGWNIVHGAPLLSLAECMGNLRRLQGFDSPILPKCNPKCSVSAVLKYITKPPHFGEISAQAIPGVSAQISPPSIPNPKLYIP
jgi:hypothetical protein